MDSEDVQPKNDPLAIKSKKSKLNFSLKELLEYSEPRSEQSEEAGPSSRRRRRQIGPYFDASLMSPVKKRRPTTLSAGEQELIINIYKSVRNTWPADAYASNEKMIEKTSEISGVSKRSIYRILGAYRNTNTVSEKRIMKNKKKSLMDKLDNFDKSAIRTKIYQFFYAGELPTLSKILQSINEDDQLPNLSESTLRRMLRHLKFKYIKQNGKSVLIDCPEMVLWRTKYLEEIEQFRKERRHIFYLDETSVSAGHTMGKVWEDSTIQSAIHGLMEGLTTDPKNANGKGKRLIVVNIGNEEGFVDGCQWIFESTTKGDYHESMDPLHFEKWFGTVLNKLQNGDVIVMDNASYHSRRLEKIPTMSWRKKNTKEWLNTKHITHLPTDTKAHLIQKVKAVKDKYQSFITDEMAKEKGITVLRLPPYHCELNPIEHVWVAVKGHVARNNTTFELSDVKKLLEDGLAQVTPEIWKNCVQHVLALEEKMRDLDDIIDETADRFLLNVTGHTNQEHSSSESSTSGEDLSDDGD